MILFKSTAILILIFISSVSLYGQEMYPSITLKGALYPSRDLTDTTGSYSHQRVTLGVTIPLLKKIKLDDNGLRFGLLSLGVNSSVDNTTISFIDNNRALLMTNASVSGIYKSSKKNLWLGKLTGSFFEDETIIHHPSLRVSGMALYRRSVSEKIFYIAGGIYNFSFGRGLALPILGAGLNFANHSSFSFILPLSMTYRFGKPGNQCSLFLRPNGFISNFSNNGIYANAPEKIVFRKREFTLGIEKRFKLSDRWSLFTEAGLLMARIISFTDGFTRSNDSVIFESKIQPGAYLSAGLKFKIKVKDLPEVDDQIYQLGY